MRPYLYIDVDGPLNPHAANPKHRPAGYTAHRMRPESWIAQHPGKPRPYIKPLTVWLRPGHGTQLLALADRYDLMWASMWVVSANSYIAPVLGLPELPVVTWPTTGTDHPAGLCWKTDRLIAHAGGRPFAWIDDELGEPDRTYTAQHHPGPALLRWIDPRVGLAESDFAALAAFAAESAAAS